MAGVPLTAALRDEYQRLFDTCRIDAARAAEVESLVGKVARNAERYRAVAGRVGAPWMFVGVIHNMEASLSFDGHLHNGDPLTARTVQVPAGRPAAGQPPFSWEASAEDALRLRRIDRWKDWSLPGLLYQLEAFNGWGYRLFHPHVLSPYLWSGSSHYTSGKFVKDGVWSDTAVSRQTGSAALLRRMAEHGDLDLELHVGEDVPDVDLESARPPLRFSPNREVAGARELQEFMNRFPGIFLRIDGKPGEKTSDAFKLLTGHFLDGDPRAA
jgi:lysozyme family protein